MKTTTFLKYTLLLVLMLLIDPISVYGQDVESLKQKFMQYYNDNNYRKAIDIGVQILEIVPDSECEFLLARLGDCYFECNNTRKAVEYYERSVKVDIPIYGEHSIEVARMQFMIGKIHYLMLKEYNKALDLFSKVETTYNKLYGPNSTEVANVVERIGKIYYYYLNNNNKARECFTRVYNIYSTSGSDYSYQAAVMLEYLGNLYIIIDHDYSRAIECYLNIKKEYENLYGEDDNTISNLLCQIGDCYLALKDYSSALQFYLDGNSNYINNGFDFGDVKRKMGLCYYHNGDLDSAYPNIKKGLKMEHSLVMSFLSIQTKDERNEFWKDYFEVYQSIYPAMVTALNDKSSFGDLYNKSALFAKGMLLSAETELQRLIIESGDSTLIATFNELQSVNCKIIKLKEFHSNEDKKNTESLKNYAEKLELYLIIQSKAYGDFMKNLQLTWKNVQDSLKQDDIAIELLSFPKFGTDSTQYIALTLRNIEGYDQPHLIELCEESELLEAAKQPYTSKALSDLIWGKLAEKGELDDKVKNIYFSPCGELHNIAIESMPHWSKQGVMMNDSIEGFNIYRLSSTRELAISRKPIESSDAAVYGGIDYSAPKDKMGLRVQEHESATAIDSKDDEVFIPSTETIRKSDKGKQAPNRAYEIVTDSTGTRDYLWWNPLQGAKEEATAVNSLLKGKGFDVYFKSDDYDEQLYNATEASFKQLAGQKRSIIHIATHGFYWNDSTALQEKMENNLNFMPANYESLQNTEKAMVRAGLLFTGAQNTFMGEKITDEYEDGVLTAQEVSQLDLRGLELLVLSACQTGLGEIGGDGVFGLQRGFKKAGAQTIVMSLWKVNDEATKDMMTSFYTHLMEMGMEHKREAFMKAQQEVRDNDYRKNKYSYSYTDNDNNEVVCTYKDNPQKFEELRNTRPHWAAFIMLDGMNK